MTDTSDRRPPKIALVFPSSDQCVQSLFVYHKNHAIGHKPPQSTLILATYLKAMGFDDVTCIDAQLEGYSPEQTAEAVAALAPDIVGVTAWTDFWYPTWRTMKLVREKLPDCTIVAGGPHCSVYPQETVEHSEADYVVAGDGEDVLLNIVRAIAESRVPDEQPGLWRMEHGEARAPLEHLAVIDDVTKVPPPDRTLLPHKRYSSVLTPADYETTMITSRGCPYKCVFCKIDVQKVYSRTAEQVVEEFRQIADLGIKDVQVYDDTFTWGKQRAIDICQGIIDSGIKVNWAIRDRANRVTPELYTLLKQAGCYRVHFGVETGSPRILKESGKFLTMEQVETAFEISRQVGMSVMGYFMFGFLDETPADARMTVDFAKKLNPDYPVFVVLIPYPGTTVYDKARELGIVTSDFWREFTINPTPDYAIPELVEDKMSRAELIEWRNTGMRETYFTPRRIMRELKSLTSVSEFSRKTRLGLALATEVFGKRRNQRHSAPLSSTS